MSKKPKRKGIKSLLTLLGADPYEARPTTLEEARFLQEDEGLRVERGTLPRCTFNGKVSFSSESQGKQAARHRLKRGANTGKLRVYKCEHCAYWHFTSQFRK